MTGKNFRASIEKSRKLVKRKLCKEIEFIIRKRQMYQITKRSIRMGFEPPIFVKYAK
jgi:hypothetical protein